MKWELFSYGNLVTCICDGTSHNIRETGDINTMLCPIKDYSNTIELTVHPSCYGILDLLCVIAQFRKISFWLKLIKLYEHI